MNYQRPSIREVGDIRNIQNPLIRLKPRTIEAIDWRVGELKQFLDRHDGTIPRDIDQVCRQLELDICTSTVCRLFKRSIGMGIREYAMHQRLKKAADQLKNTCLSIKEIAAELGYRSARELARRFRKEFYVSPHEYRQNYRSIKGIHFRDVIEDPIIEIRGARNGSLKKKPTPNGDVTNHALRTAKIRPTGHVPQRKRRRTGS